MIEKGAAALTVTLPSDREIVMTRVFDAPSRLVFEAWTRPEHVPHWFGPRGHTLAICDIDLRPGGSYRFVSRDADGSEHPFKGVYREIAPPGRLVYTQIYDAEGWSNRESVITVTLEEHEGRTTMTCHSQFESVQDRDAMLEAGMERGASEGFDRLDELLQTMA
jgi:uncharacterized protein YndB with AHSA1/START domain